MSGEKSFAPSAKRRRDAALKGDVVRSRELGTALAVLIGAVWLKFAGPWVFGILTGSLRSGLTWDRQSLEAISPGQILMPLLWAVLPPILLLAGGIMLAVFGTQMGMGEGRWIGANLMPKASRINPLSGLKRMFGATGWIEAAKGVAKVTLLGALAWNWGHDRLFVLLTLGRSGSLFNQLGAAWDALISLMFTLAVGLVIIALFDVPVQLIRRYFRLRMSHQDLRDEQKEADGSPENKAAIRSRQRQLAKGGVAGAMREAQFVLTNPTHFSVAMAYDPAKAAAPIVLAKGRGEKALAMRELAAEMDVPMLEYPALARSVYFTTRENQVIREELYAAVAGVLAFVLSLKRGENPMRPAIEVPVMLRFDADGRADPKAAS